MKTLLASILLLAAPNFAQAQSFTTVPFIFIFGQPANASQVMADFQSVVNNGNAVANYINSQIAAVTPPPSGSLIYFNLASCPAGWALVNYGTNFARGLDLGRGQDTTGTAQGGSEATTVQDHIHSTSPVVYTIGNVLITPGGSSTRAFMASSSFATSPQTGAPSVTAGTEARPKNVSLLLCSKN